MTETLDTKAQRLRLHGRIRELPNARLFVVSGDTGLRYVAVPGDERFSIRCDCPALGGCSHLAAVNGVLLDEQEEGRGVGAPDPQDQGGEVLDHATG